MFNRLGDGDAIIGTRRDRIGAFGAHSMTLLNTEVKINVEEKECASLEGITTPTTPPGVSGDEDEYCYRDAGYVVYSKLHRVRA